MAKVFDFPYPDFLEKDLFLVVRDKRHICIVLLNSLRHILAFKPGMISAPAGIFTVAIDKRRRIFFNKDRYFFSLSFPFHVVENEGEFSISLDNGLEITNHMISFFLGIFEQEDNSLYMPWEEFSEHELEDDLHEDFWLFYKFLLSFEAGYLRFEVDIDHQHPIFHPLNHVDCFFSQSASFKVGFYNPMSIQDFKDLLDPDKPVDYLSKYIEV